jgi:hypothetical protein
MGQIHFHSDTKKSSLGLYTALDMQLNAAIVDCFYIICLRTQYGPKLGVSNYLYDHGFATEAVKFSNPFDWWAMLRNVTKDVTEATLNRTIFYQAESRKRNAEAESVEQDVIKKKLENLTALNKLRQDLVQTGVGEEEATKAIASFLNDQKATLESNSKRNSLL